LLQKTAAGDKKDYFSICKCLVLLDDWKSMSELLQKLLTENELLAYQTTFDLLDFSTQEFKTNLLSSFDSQMDVDDAVVVNDSSKLEKLKRILNGSLVKDLQLEFLYKNNKSDLLILKNIKNYLDSRSSVYHSALTFANSYMNAGNYRLFYI
jgi:26S proteasome regulatory subunit N2